MIVAAQRLPILIATRPPLVHARMHCRAAGGLPLRPSSFGVDGADRVEAGSAFRSDGRVQIETWGPGEDFGLGWHRDGADLQSSGIGQLCLGEDRSRRDQSVQWTD